MDFLFGGIAGMAGILAVQTLMNRVGRARIYDLDGRQLVEFMHLSELRLGQACADPLPPLWVGRVSPAGGTRYRAGASEAAPRRLRVVTGT
jgi:hypothetical protein